MHSAPPSSSDPTHTVATLVGIINGDIPREVAARIIDTDVVIHMDSATHVGLDMWLKWIHLIRTFGRLRDLRMINCDIRADAVRSDRVHLSSVWSGSNRSRAAATRHPRVGDFQYRVRDGRVVEIWTHKVNYIPIFGPLVRFRIMYRLLLAGAVLYFWYMRAAGRDYRAMEA